MAKKETFHKVMMIVFLVLLVIGFSVPLFTPSQSPDAIPEQRICQFDADCYLICDDLPNKVLCSQNLCLQNSCDNAPLYPYQETPIKFSFDVSINNQFLPLVDRANAQDQFVIFNGNIVNVHSTGITLAQVLEKARISFTGECLNMDSQSYCRNDNHDLVMMVNNQLSYLYDTYVPKDGDTISLTFR